MRVSVCMVAAAAVLSCSRVRCGAEEAPAVSEADSGVASAASTNAAPVGDGLIRRTFKVKELDRFQPLPPSAIGEPDLESEEGRRLAAQARGRESARRQKVIARIAGTRTIAERWVERTKMRLDGNAEGLERLAAVEEMLLPDEDALAARLTERGVEAGEDPDAAYREAYGEELRRALDAFDAATPEVEL